MNGSTAWQNIEALALNISLSLDSVVASGLDMKLILLREIN